VRHDGALRDKTIAMPRYELSGEFFWNIELTDTSVSTTLGKVGNAGHTRMKTYGSTAEAKRNYDELVAEKLEQGYVLVGGAAAKPRKSKAAKPRKK
jgi:predicted DNA-binding WGR domain protein